MSQNTTHYNVTQIPGGSYEGYIWMSDATHPKIFQPSSPISDIELIPGGNPFIIEAQLINQEHTLSYSIKFVDGHYVAICYDLQALRQTDGVEVTHHQFIPNRIEEAEQLLFDEYWVPVADKKCEGMEVLQPREFVFVGFTLKDNH